MSYAYRRQGSASSNPRDIGGSYYSSSNISNRSYGTGTSNSTTKTYEPYTSKYSIGASYSRPYAEPSVKSSYGLSGKYSLNDTRPTIYEPTYSPALKYSLTRFTDTSPYSTYSSRHGSSSYLSDKDSSKFPNSSLSSVETTSINSTSNSYSRNNRDSSQREKEIKEPSEPPKQSSYISRIRKTKYDDDDATETSRTNNGEDIEKGKCDMISKTSRGTCTPHNSGEEHDGSVISRTRTRRYPKQIVRIEMGGTVLVGNLSQVGKDTSTQTSDDIFIPSTRIRQSSYRSGSSKSSLSTSSYYSKPLDSTRYTRPARSSWRQPSIDSPRSSIAKKDETVFFDNFSKPTIRDKVSPPKSSSNRKSTPVSLKDSIEKVNEWQIQNKIIEKESSSPRSPVPRSPNYYDLHAASKPHSRRRNVISEEKLEETETASITNAESPKLRKQSLRDAQKHYVTQFTDLDVLLQNKFYPEEIKSKPTISQNTGDYNSSFDDSPATSCESTLIFASKESKDIFNSMSIELQHLVLRSKRQKIQFSDVLEFCRNGNHNRKFTNEDERTFTGYKSLCEMLTELGVDIKKLENSVLQLCKFRENQVEYGPFLDFDLSLHEQMDELDSFLDGTNVSVVLRTKLAVRIEALIEKLNNASGRELRRALFSLKQIFQDDKDLVQEFVVRRGLRCLRTIGSKSDQNHQNYILRALGQLMLYIDGMNGVLADPETIEWLYSLLQGNFRLVVKLALKLLVVFIEYTKNPELHATVIISSVAEYHRKSGGEPWSLTMKIIAEEDTNDSELVTYAITFINKVLSAIPEQDTFYDVTDWLEEQGIEKISAEVLKKSNADVDMVKQFQIYETVLKIEDGNCNLSIEHEGIRNLPRAKSESNLNGKRKSKRQISTQDKELQKSPKNTHTFFEESTKGSNNLKSTELSVPTKTDDGDSDIDEGSKYDPHLRRATVANTELEDFVNDSLNSSVQSYKYYKKEKRMERYKSSSNLYSNIELKSNKERMMSSSPPSRPQSLLIDGSVHQETIFESANERLHIHTKENAGFSTSTHPAITIQQDSSGPSPKVVSASNNQDLRRQSPTGEEDDTFVTMVSPVDKPSTKMVTPSVKAMKNQLASKNKQADDAQKQMAPTGDISGLISTAKGHLQNTIDKPPTQSKFHHTELTKDPKVNASNDSPNWENLELECAMKPLIRKDWDFSDLKPSEDVLDSQNLRRDSITNGVPPPPPLLPSTGRIPPSPLPPVAGPPKPPPAPATNKSQTNQNASKIPGAGISKQKRTTRLHWRIYPPAYCDNSDTIWKKMMNVSFDSEHFESLFENKPHDVKKKHEVGPKKIEVLDLKRSNAINIGMTNLPPIPSIKSAILYMHTNIINREGVEKLITTMLPTQEEIDNIRSAQSLNKDAQLGQAEGFLLALHEVNLLQPRLEVWLFQLDFDQIERDIMDSLTDLMRGIKEIFESKTLIYVLSTILALGNFLNGSQVTSFSLEYLQKVPEVKDTKHKHSLLYHVVMLVTKEFPDSTDLHSDLGALNRCHRLDWEELAKKLQKLRSDCKKCWDHLRLIFKSDETSGDVATKLKKFFWDASETIVRIEIIHRRLMTRFIKVLQYLGFPLREAEETKVRTFCRIMSDFAIEYRTTKEKFDQIKENKVKEKERKKTRGEMIVDINSLDRAKKVTQNHDQDLLNAIMSKPIMGFSDCEMDFNSLNRRPRRMTQNSISTDGLKSLPRTSSSHQMLNADSSPSVSANMTPAVSEMSLDQTDNFIDRLAQHATSSNIKRRVVRRSAGRERKSVRRTKPYVEEDVINNLILKQKSKMSY